MSPKRRRTDPDEQPAHARLPSKAAVPAPKNRPQCTHITMDRIYGLSACQVCRRRPSLGWLYVCAQDHQLEWQDSSNAIPEPANFSGDPEDKFEVLIHRATELKMSPCIVSRIIAGDYTIEQTETLVKQKERLIQAIKQAESSANLTTPPASPKTSRNKAPVIASMSVNTSFPRAGPDGVAVAPAGTSTNTSAESTIRTPTKSRRKATVQTNEEPKCELKVCHRCRPYCVDRLYMSFETVLAGQVPAVTEEEITHLPFCDPYTVRNLGLRTPPPPPSVAIQQQLESGDVTGDWTPSSASESEEEGDFGGRHASSNSTMDHTGLDGSQDTGLSTHGPYETPFKDRTPHRTSQDVSPTRTSFTASSISLPTPVSLGMTPYRLLEEEFDLSLGRRLPKAASHCGVLTDDSPRRGRRIAGKESQDSFGSEVKVEGGVALTEDAVENHTPDVFTSV